MALKMSPCEPGFRLISSLEKLNDEIGALRLFSYRNVLISTDFDIFLKDNFLEIDFSWQNMNIADDF